MQNLLKLHKFVFSFENWISNWLIFFQSYEKTIRQLDDDKYDSMQFLVWYSFYNRTRKNKETMENLQTLLKEMTYIEEVNEKINMDLAAEREQHAKTKEQLATR